METVAGVTLTRREVQREMISRDDGKGGWGRLGGSAGGTTKR